MNSYERVMGVLAGQKVDRTPVIPILMAFAARYLGKTYRDFYLDHRVLVESYLRCLKDFQLDMVMVISDPFRETEGFGATFTYPETSVPVMKDPVLTDIAHVGKLRKPDLQKAARMADRLAAVAYFHREVGGEVPILGWVEGPVAEAGDLRGLQELMMDFFDNPEPVRELLEMTTAVALDFAKAQIEAGADMIGIGDAAASLFSPQTYREFILPYEQRLIAGIHAAGAKVKLHICGNITNLLPDLAATGADMIDLDWMVGLKTARQLLGGRVALCGNIDPVSVILHGKPEDIEAASRNCLAEADGPFILSAGCEIPVDTPPENLAALCRAVRT